ncbi:hypothetical protein C8N24_5568 [Solirubrobacter pauli]|uniref:Uncharacterized protein n=1 Tax=Solirubrobacter pauli TaxID=166793 RepID=A0A660L6I0_9ACTN|nr:hypothetical protein [Solirubrobacter pauli]RKQ87543.1 hypothetical protein C8N24_5568 [Solirubrobacter pauli]
MTASHSFTRAAGAAVGLAVLLALYFLLGPASAPRVVAAASAGAGNAASAAADGYSVLERPATPDDDISRWATPAAARRLQGPGMDPSLRFEDARVVYRDDTRSVAIVPSSTTPCLVTQFGNGSGGITCSPTLTYGSSFGVVPDSVKEVEFTLTDGSVVSHAVQGNVWHSPAEAASVRYVIAGTSTDLALMPLSSLPKDAKLSRWGTVSSATTEG